MNILHVCAVYPPFIGGAATYTAEISRRFAAAGHHVHVLTTDIAQIDLTWSPRGRRVPHAASHPTHVPHSGDDGVSVARLTVRHLPLAPYSFYALRRLMPVIAPFAPPWLLRTLGGWVPRLGIPQICRNMLEQTYDVVHLINITMESPLLLAAAAHQRRTPMLCTPFVHVGAPEVMRNYVMPHQIDLMRRSTRVFVQTSLEGDALLGVGVDPQAIRRLGMGVNPSEADGADGARFRARHGISADAPIVSFMGSITRDKGAVALLHAMQALWAAGSRAVLALAGEAPAPGGFSAALARLPHTDRQRVLLTGALHGREKHDFLAASQVFALPSRVDSFGIVFLEAWMHGLPVIGADAGGIPAVITHDHDGYVLPFDDVHALSLHIQRLLEQPELARSLGAAGRAKVLANYTWDAIHARLTAAYLETKPASGNWSGSGS